MKLLELLARELKEWPSNAYVAVQDDDSDHTIWFLESDHRDLSFVSGEWKCSSPFDILISRPSILASDHAFAIVTSSDWSAERARIAKPAKKEGKDGWIRHRGGKAPVSDDVFIDVRYRDGEILECQKFEKSEAYLWAHGGSCGDIMAYRLHKPAEQVEACSKPELQINLPGGYGEIYNAQAVEQGPLQWRDRITEIDATTQALTTERADLVQKLASEGFAVIGRINELLTDAEQKHEDMSDWRNWKVGDIVECVSHNERWSAKFAIGSVNVIKEIITDSDVPVDLTINIGYYVSPFDFKWHSRPSA